MSPEAKRGSGITNGVPTSSINWGVGSPDQSGYDFTRAIPGPQTLRRPRRPFPSRNVTHRNSPSNDPSLTREARCCSPIKCGWRRHRALSFTFMFTHEETPNGQNPCPYPTPSGEGCTDRSVSFQPPTDDVQRRRSRLHVIDVFCRWTTATPFPNYHPRRPRQHRQLDRPIHITASAPTPSNVQFSAAAYTASEKRYGSHRHGDPNGRSERNVHCAVCFL